MKTVLHRGAWIVASITCAALLLACGEEGSVEPKGASESAESPADAEPTPTPTAEPPLAEARIDGRWDYRRRTTVSRGWGEKDPRVVRFVYTIRHSCDEGPCDAVVRYKNRTLGEEGRYELSFEDDRYVRVDKQKVPCGDIAAGGAYTNRVVLEPLEAEMIDEVWTATRLGGTLDIRVRATPEGKEGGCGTAVTKGTIEATRVGK